MAIEKQRYQTGGEVQPEQQVEAEEGLTVELPEEANIAGELVDQFQIDSQGQIVPMLPDIIPPELEHNINIANIMDESQLGVLSNELLEA